MIKWCWRPATGTDIQPIVDIAVAHFEQEIDHLFTPDPVAYSRNLTLSVVNSFYLPTTEMLWVCEQAGRIIAYVWAHRSTAPWSDDPMCSVRMVHIDLTLPVRDRIRLVSEMIEIWERWAQKSGIPVICSTTMRGDQQGFLKIHQRCGYDVRGSFAYKRLGQGAVQHPD
jgi:hypothetical protein